MVIGSFVRQNLGSLERPISDLYRSVFIDIDKFVTSIKKWIPEADKIIELGCGEGAVTEQLVQNYQDTEITGIDLTPRVGRMFQGDSSRVTFKQQKIENFITENTPDFDLLIICDVMHHVPWEMHEELLKNAGQTLKPGGYLVLKDWERNKTPIHGLCYFADRYITGDRVKYKTADELRKMIRDIFGENSIKAEERVSPWSNNIAFLVLPES